MNKTKFAALFLVACVLDSALRNLTPSSWHHGLVTADGLAFGFTFMIGVECGKLWRTNG